MQKREGKGHGRGKWGKEGVEEKKRRGEKLRIWEVFAC